MSDEELIEGYTRGRISRRTFVRRLVASGLSVAAAIAYGNALAARPAAGSPSHTQQHNDHHNDHHNNNGSNIEVAGAGASAPVAVVAPPRFTG
jgi:hypothetical protein